ncbi:MAG: hypothetical protein RB148_10375, partial [Armatimonadota bacterium]|nr:hypothetical protein [Armatimonadota bacterium]
MSTRQATPRFSEREERLLASLTADGVGTYALIGGLLAVFLWGLVAYATQLRHGLGVTGLRDHVLW